MVSSVGKFGSAYRSIRIVLARSGVLKVSISYNKGQAENVQGLLKKFVCTHVDANVRQLLISPEAIVWPPDGRPNAARPRGGCGRVAAVKN